MTLSKYVKIEEIFKSKESILNPCREKLKFFIYGLDMGYPDSTHTIHVSTHISLPGGEKKIIIQELLDRFNMNHLNRSKYAPGYDDGFLCILSLSSNYWL